MKCDFSHSCVTLNTALHNDSSPHLLMLFVLPQSCFILKQLSFLLPRLILNTFIAQTDESEWLSFIYFFRNKSNSLQM